MNVIFNIDFYTQILLPTAVSLAIFYLFYKAIVRNDTHLNIRRFTILGFLVFAMVLPFLHFYIPVTVVADTTAGVGFARPIQNLIHELPVFTVFAEGNVVGYTEPVETRLIASLPSVLQIIGWIYLAIVLILIGRIFVGVWRLSRISKYGRRDKACLVSTINEKIIISKNIPTAFSFFKTIFIPETWANSDEKEMVLAHERVHVNQKHSWDLMLMEVICAVQFFNPFVWLLKREMRLNHEYLADKGALKNNENPEFYFQFLLQEIIGKQPILVHSLHYSPIKNRIMMQISKPAKLLNQVRYLAFVPVVLALTFLFACQEQQHVQSPIPEDADYIFLTAEQLEPLGFTLNEHGLIYANFNPNVGILGDEEYLRDIWRFLAIINSTNRFNSSVMNNETPSDLETFWDGIFKGVEVAQLNLSLRRACSNGHQGFGVRHMDEKFVPIAFLMAESGIPNRTDTLVFWFVPTEDLQNALPRGVNMMDFLRYPPMSEQVREILTARQTARVDTLFEWDGESIQQLHRSARRYDFDSVLMISYQGVFFYTRSNDYLLRWPYSTSEWRGRGGIRMSRRDGGGNLLSIREVMLMAGGTVEDADWWEERMEEGRRQALARREVRRQTAYAEREFLSTMSDEDAIDVTWEIAQTMAPPRSATGDLVPYSTVAVTPEFPGGIDALHDFLRDNLVFPEEAREQGIQGTVFVSFIVEQRGRISNVELVRGIGGGADEEAIRVVSMMPNWTPGEHHGRPVRVQFNMPIRFAFMGETPQG